ncbi:MAG: hypothetical protein EON90_13225 [Brevundimonas sp.]|nr:MAG: hypothetical protein EON90_13225 [Brevundimonas sp.]
MLNPPQARNILAGMVVGAAVIAHGSAVAAQTQDREMDRVGGLAPVAGYSTLRWDTRQRTDVAIFMQPREELRLPDGSLWIDFVARQRTTDSSGAQVTMWASTRNCPALRNTLIWLTTLQAPRFEIPGIAPSEAAHEGRRPIGMPTDGLQTTVWGRGTQPDYTANTRVEVSSNGGLIAKFGAAATENLASCWQSEQPIS